MGCRKITWQIWIIPVINQESTYYWYYFNEGFVRVMHWPGYFCQPCRLLSLTLWCLDGHMSRHDSKWSWFQRSPLLIYNHISLYAWQTHVYKKDVMVCRPVCKPVAVSVLLHFTMCCWAIYSWGVRVGYFPCCPAVNLTLAHDVEYCGLTGEIRGIVDGRDEWYITGPVVWLKQVIKRQVGRTEAWN